MLRWDRALQEWRSLRLDSFLQFSSSLQTMQCLRSLGLVGRGMCCCCCCCCPLLLLLPSLILLVLFALDLDDDEYLL